MNKEVERLVIFFIFVSLFLLVFFLLKEQVSLQPSAILISQISPNIAYNSQSTLVTIYGAGFTQTFSLSFTVSGSSFTLDPALYNPQWISEGEIIFTAPSGLPPIIGELSVIDSNSLESNRYPFEVRQGIAPPSPSIVQVTPINLQNPLDLEVVPIKIWGNNFDSSSKIILDGVDLSSRILSRNDKKIEFYLDKNEMLAGKQVRVDNEGNTRSNIFNINETTIKYPDLIRLKDSIVYPGEIIEVTGNNFYPSNSKLYVDDVYVDDSNYVLTQTPSGNFKITLNANEYSIGPHKIYFDNPPRYPNMNYNYKRLKSNKLYFEIKSLGQPDTVLENNKIRIVFDGDSGNIKKIENKDTGYSHNIQNDFPWRMILREINSTSQLARDNPLSFSIAEYDDQDIFNPFKGGCNDIQFSSQSQANLQILSVIWPGCQIDSNNRFDFVQRFFLEPDKPYFEMNFSMDNVDIMNYSINLVMVYATILDDPSVNESAIMVDRVHETVRNPGFNVLTRGSRNLCPGWYQPLTEGQIPCGAQGQEQVVSYSDMGVDGEGIRTNDASWIDFWMGYWNQNGDYIYGIAIDNFTYAKGYSYQGEEGAFKNSAWVFFPDDFDYRNFNYKMPYSFRIGIGKGTTFTGDETWINIADKFKEIQQSKGMIKTPFILRNISENAKYLDITTAANLGGEFFEYVGGAHQIRANPNIEEIANLYEESRKFTGAEESTILVWGGDQDDTQGYGKFVPIPGISYPFYRAINLAGWNPCFYTMNAGFFVRGDEPILPRMIADGELLEFDPTGQPSIIPPGAPLNANSFANLAPGSIGLAETDNSYLKWFLEKYRVMNNNNEGTRCFYSDGIFTASGWTNAGPRSIKYGYKGHDDKQFNSIREFFRKELEEVRRIDPETYTFHEGTAQLTADEDLFPFQPAASAGATPQTGLAGTNYKNAQKTQFLQRVYGGYIDFLLSNEIVDPNKITLIHIPDSFLPGLKAIPGVPQDYDKTMVETYLLPGWVGFLYKSAVPYYVEVGVGEISDYTPNHRLSEVPPESPYYPSATFDYWVAPLEEYSNLNKEVVNARQLARNYFHGLWNLPIPTNSPEEEYYYISDWVLFTKSREGGAISTKFPRVINSVRQALVGEDWGQKFGLMFINTYAREPYQTVDFTFEFDRYGLIAGQNYNLFKYSKENGREYIRTVNNDFQYTIIIPARKFVLLELEEDGDGDSDGINEIIDKCPNTDANHIVNPQGCSVPITTGFSPAVTSNLISSPNLFNHPDFSIGNQYGRIEYIGQNVRLLEFNIRTQALDGIDLEDAIEISQNKISVNTDDYPGLDQTARITFEGLSYSNTPIVTIETGNGFVPCPQTQCQIQSYDSQPGRLVALVAGFSNYSTQASTGTTTTGSSSSGSSSGSSTSGSTGTTGNPLTTQCNDGLDNDNDLRVDYPDDSGCSNEFDNLEANPIITQTGTEGEETSSGNGLEIKIVFWIVVFILVCGIFIIAFRIINEIKMKNRFASITIVPKSQERVFEDSSTNIY